MCPARDRSRVVQLRAICCPLVQLTAGSDLDLSCSLSALSKTITAVGSGPFQEYFRELEFVLSSCSERHGDV